MVAVASVEAFKIRRASLARRGDESTRDEWRGEFEQAEPGRSFDDGVLIGEGACLRHASELAAALPREAGEAGGAALSAGADTAKKGCGDRGVSSLAQSSGRGIH